jgi:hypothetical protein
MSHVEDETVHLDLDESSGEYSLADSRKNINELYPVLVDAHGNIIDGNSRIDAFPRWRREVRKDIKSESQLWLARIVANSHRRLVSRNERAEQLEALSRSLIKNEGVLKANLVKVLASLTTFSPSYIYRLLPEDLKRSYSGRNDESPDSPDDAFSSEPYNGDEDAWDDESYSTLHESDLRSHMDVNHVHNDLRVRRVSLQISRDSEEDSSQSVFESSPNGDDSLEKLEIIVDQREPEWVCRERALRRIRRVFDEENDPDFDYLSWEASILDGVSLDVALELIDQVMRERDPEHEHFNHLIVDKVVTCPLCNREGASSRLIIERARDPRYAQSTLMEFIEEACIVDEPY